MLRVAFWAFNIWSAKKGFDLLKENTELKLQNRELGTTVRTLANQVPADEIKVVEITPNNHQHSVA